jgi:hypothetical protein
MTQDLRQLGAAEFTGSTRAVRVRRQPDLLALAHGSSSSGNLRLAGIPPARGARPASR